jgi:hypothetical protein
MKGKVNTKANADLQNSDAGQLEELIEQIHSLTSEAIEKRSTRRKPKKQLAKS